MERRLIGILFILGLAAVLTAPPGPAYSAPTLVYEDAKITGKEIVSFTDDQGRGVLVVLGDFRLTTGERTLTARDGVVWVQTVAGSRGNRNRITVYAEGGARDSAGGAVVKPTWTAELLQQGRLTLGGHLSQGPVKDFPLYQRAKDAVAAEAQRAATAVAPAAATPDETQPSSPNPPELIAAPRAGSAEPPTPASRPGGPKAPPPVYFHADRITSETVDGRRVTVAKGNVYLSQGSPESQRFVELRSQSAVIFSQKAEEAKVARSPVSPKVTPGKENIAGVYLEGDVMIIRGERYLRGHQAYYDFVTDRAYMPNAVFRTIQEQRNIPIYIRAKTARMLSAREMYFRDAQVTTSDFYSPSWAIAAGETYVMDATPYDEKGKAVGPESLEAKMKNVTFDIRSVPILYVPYWKADLEREPTALRTVRIGQHGSFGFGVETEWHLFRLLGLVEPQGVRAFYELDWYTNGGILTGVNFDYARQEELRRYSGYGRLFGLFNGGTEDRFGEARTDIGAPDTRSRALWRHKEYLPQDWELQFELSYLSDRNFLERYWPTEFFAGKEQENLLYAKKQRDNWALTALLKYRLNDFYTQTESWPDLGFYLEGEPLWGDRLTFFSESHAGLVRLRPDDLSTLPGSDVMGRLDTRNEVDLPLKAGPVSVVPYAVGRLTYWSDKPAGGENFRPYGQVGAKASTSFWRVYDVSSRLWDVSGLRHIVTPQVVVFASGSGASPSDLFPLDPGIEQHLDRTSGFSAGAYQVLQTKRGPPGAQHIVDWMRLDVVASFYDPVSQTLPGDGRFYLSRPEYSLARNSIDVDYSWYISDATTFLAEVNYDTDNGTVPWAAAGLSIVRSPRLAYYVGVRAIKDMDSLVGTFGANYQINRKYSISIFEQYDFDYRNNPNLATSIALVRKLERWYAALTFTISQADNGNQMSILLSLWPEGIPEFRIGGSSRSQLLRQSSSN